MSTRLTRTLLTFADAFLGHYDPLDAYVEQLTDDLSYTAELARVPESLQPYVHLDIAALARDLHAGGNVYVAPDSSGGVWLSEGHM